MSNLPGTILLAEDNPIDVELARRALAECRIANPLIEVHDGAEAIQYLSGQDRYSDREQFPFPILLFLDIMMPKVTGTEVLQWLRESKTELPVVVLTSYRNDPNVDRAIYPGAQLYLPKPLNRDHLKQIADLLNWSWALYPQPIKPS